MKDNTRKLVEFVECVCNKPTLFVKTGSFDEVATFLEGYTEGIIQFAPPDIKVNCLRAFGRWLSQRYEKLEDIPETVWWAGKLRHMYPEDQEALQELIRLYRDFVNDSIRVETSQ